MQSCRYPLELSTQHWDRFKQHVCQCDAGWEGLACSRKICPRGDYAMTFLEAEQLAHSSTGEDDDEELADTVGCDVQRLVFQNLTEGDHFVLTFTNHEMNSKMTAPIAYSANASGLARAIKTALELLPNDVLPSVTTAAAPSSVSGDALEVLVTFTDAHTTGEQEVLACTTVQASSFCGAGMQPMLLPTASGVGTCWAQRDAVDELRENWECGGRGRCDRALGVCRCNMGTYGVACDLTTDYV